MVSNRVAALLEHDKSLRTVREKPHHRRYNFVTPPPQSFLNLNLLFVPVIYFIHHSCFYQHPEKSTRYYLSIWFNHTVFPRNQPDLSRSASSSSSSSSSSRSFEPARVRDHRRRPCSGKLAASATSPPGRREATPFFLHAVSSPALGEQGVGGVGVSCDGREDSKKVDGGRRRPSIRRVVRHTWSRVVSFFTIMTTWVLFRFLLKGLNKV